MTTVPAQDRDELLCPDAPGALQIEITSHCNLRCKMCPLTTGESSSAMTAGHMTDVVWSELLPLARQAKQVFVAGFGEPLTNPRCIELLRQLNDEGIRITLTTNGLALNPTIADQLAALPFLVHINVSIDSPDPASYRQIRGGNLQRALGGLTNLVRALPDTSRITVSSVAMRENIDTLPDFAPLLGGLGIRTYILQGLNEYNGYSKEQRLLGADRLAEGLSRLRSACAEWGIELVMTAPDRTTVEEHPVDASALRYFDDLGDHSETRQCELPWQLPYVDKDGRVFPCCIAGASSQSELGQIGQPDSPSLDEIWVGPEYQAFRKALLDPATTPQVCRDCTIVPLGPHPFRAYSAALVSRDPVVAKRGIVTVRFRNTGSQAWAPDSVRVGTTKARDRRSKLEQPSWISWNRPCSFREPTVAPGEVATFTFGVRVPTRQVLESFQLVADGLLWMPNTGFTVATPTALQHPIRTLRHAGKAGPRVVLAQLAK